MNTDFLGGSGIVAIGVSESGLGDTENNSKGELKDSCTCKEDLLDLSTEVHAGELDHQENTVDKGSQC